MACGLDFDILVEEKLQKEPKSSRVFGNNWLHQPAGCPEFQVNLHLLTSWLVKYTGSSSCSLFTSSNVTYLAPFRRMLLCTQESTLVLLPIWPSEINTSLVESAQRARTHSHILKVRSVLGRAYLYGYKASSVDAAYHQEVAFFTLHTLNHVSVLKVTKQTSPLKQRWFILLSSNKQELKDG